MANQFKKCFWRSEGIFQPTIYLFLIIFIDPIAIRKFWDDFVFNRTIIYSIFYYRRNSKNTCRSNYLWTIMCHTGIFTSEIYIYHSTTNFDKPLFFRKYENKLVTHKKEIMETYWYLLTRWGRPLPYRIFSDIYSHDYFRILIFYNG